jgi:para-aminobenzoate synthetase component 1
MRIGWTIQEIMWPRDTADTVAALAGDGELAWLDSATAGGVEGPPARYSLICCEPLATVEQSDGRLAELSLGGVVVDRARNGWSLWREAHARVPGYPTAAWNVGPGWVGYVGFEMARQLERLPRSHSPDQGLPLLRMGLFDRGLVLDHGRRRAFAVAADGLRSALGLGAPSPGAWVERCQTAARAGPRRSRLETARLHFEMERGVYERVVTRALEYIAAGDIYQVNLAQRLRFEGISSPMEAYRALRRVNPAPYAALLRWSAGAIGSVSPELFLRLRGRAVRTRPIKGTRPRTRDSVLDAAYRTQLIDSVKDSAELAMIIDLHRNDLGRVCDYGSVRVRHARRLETHPTVFHTVAEVSGRLRAGCDALDLLAACFPAGSISGVPKIRALQIIDELEPVARGAYTGAVGALGLDGQMTFNVAIRTLQFCGRTATLHVGGGIVADSDPAEEYEETLAKARGIVQALSGAKQELRTA